MDFIPPTNPKNIINILKSLLWRLEILETEEKLSRAPSKQSGNETAE